MPVTQGGGGPVAAAIILRSLLQLRKGLQDVEDGAHRPGDVLDAVNETFEETFLVLLLTCISDPKHKTSCIEAPMANRA